MTCEHTHILRGFSNMLALAIFGVNAQKGIVSRESEKKFNKGPEVHIYQFAGLQADELLQKVQLGFDVLLFSTFMCWVGSDGSQYIDIPGSSPSLPGSTKLLPNSGENT